MPKAAKTKTPRAARPAPVRVSVVGGGLAGMTAALQLATRGFKVTLYEAKDTLGGNLSSEQVNGVYHDVYPHMFCTWYSNFWSMYRADLNFIRAEQFDFREGVKLLQPGCGDYKELRNATTVEAILANLKSGVLPLPDMFLTGFAMLDLAATPFNRNKSDQLEQLDVNGFLYSRGYSTEHVAKLQNYILMVIWSIQSELTSAASYQDFIKHMLAFPEATPFAWLLKGSTYEKLIEPFETKLLSLGCEIKKGASVRSVAIVGAKAKLTIETTKPQPGGRRRTRVEDAPDHVVLAVPAASLSKLALGGRQGERIIDFLPQLSELRRLRCEAIPVVDVYFKVKLKDIPREQVALADSICDLTLLDISQLWTDDPNMKDRTALVLAASNGFALPTADPLEQGHIMIRTLHGYLPVFEPGAHWGDPNSDIDWEKSLFRSNETNKLFLNEVGSWGYRPVASYRELAGVFFAGDFCRTDVDMATIEAAVQSGMNAAEALLEQDATARDRPLVNPVVTEKHKVHPDVKFLAAKLALLPFAYAATAWSAAREIEPEMKKGPLGPKDYSPATYALLLPLAYTLDWWKTVYWLARRAFPGPEGTGESDQDVAPSDLLSEAKEALKQTAAALTTLAPRPLAQGSAPPPLGLALSEFVGQAWRTAQAAFAAVQPPAPKGPDEPDTYKRRWRAKP